MGISEKKLTRLTRVAKLYYEHSETQNDIAELIGVSRPMISRMLLEAKQLGIVHIEVRSPLAVNHLLARFRSICPLKGGAVVQNLTTNNLTNNAISLAMIDLLPTLNAHYMGLGWGEILGYMALQMEADLQDLIESVPEQIIAQRVFPLIGSSGISSRSYHSSALTRIFSRWAGADACYLHSPAFFASAREIDSFRETEHYNAFESHWTKLDTALIEIGNYPSVPDFATQARFRHLLVHHKAIGRFIAYYYDCDGEIIYSDTDYAMQIPIEMLAKRRNVVAICSTSVQPAALLGALRTGLFTHLVAPESLVQDTLALLPMGPYV